MGGLIIFSKLKYLFGIEDSGCVCNFYIIYLVGFKEIEDFLNKNNRYELISSKF